MWDYIATIRNDLDINGSFGFEVFDYQAEKCTLQDKINRHNNRASFHGSSITLKTGESITLTQRNNTISQSTVVDAGGLDVSVSGNKLTLIAKSTSSESSRITFKKVGNVTNDTETSPLLYSHPTLQDRISGGNPDPISFYLDGKNRT